MSVFKHTTQANLYPLAGKLPIVKIIKKLGYQWVKPYPIYSKSPENAKEILKEDATEVNPNTDIYGFFDESAFQNKSNHSKVLKKRRKTQNKSKSRQIKIKYGWISIC